MPKIDAAATARRYKLDKEKLAFADLLAVGWTAKDAWATVIRQGLQWPASALKSAIETLEQNENVQQRVSDVKEFLGGTHSKSGKNDKGAELSGSDISKESMLKELIAAKKDLIPGSNEWRDINKMIIDVTRMKQDDVRDEDTTVHFYLPAKDER